MFSVTPEPAASKPAYAAFDPQARQTRAEQPSSDGFAALVDSNASASSDPRPAPDTSAPPRRDSRDTRQADAPPPGKDRPQADSPTSANKDSSAAQQDAGPSTPADAKATGGKTDGKDKTASDAAKTDDKSGSDDAAASAAIPVIPAIVTDPVAVVITAAANPVAAAADETASATTTAATAAITGTSAVITPADASAAQAAAVAEAAITSATTAADPSAPAVAATPGATAATAAATTVIKSDGGKTEIPAKTAETAPAKDGKDGKQAADPSAKPVPDQTVKPETAASNADDKPAQHDKAAAESGTADAEPTKHAAKATPQAEHRTAASAPQPALQTEPGLQPPIAVQSLVQVHAANLTAIPVPAANTTLADSAPVPLNGLAADIALRAAGGNSRFEICLDPAELGRIDVRLDVDKHGNVTSHLTVERPATLDMLRNDAPRLQQALEDAGLKTGDSGLQFSLRDQSSSGRDGDNGSGRNSQRVVITEEDAVPAQVAGRTYGRTLGASSGVDIRI